MRSRVPESFAVWGNGYLLGIPLPVVAAVLVAGVVYLGLDGSRWGRELTVTGEQPSAARISGKRVGALSASAYVVRVAQLKVVSTEVGVDGANRIFEVTGSSSASNDIGMDLFWRNIRTHSLHDPVDYEKNRGRS
ncbi:hypothetical protein [Arthrobacter sp. NPDC056727]|uniref:hypothetical protein n=1 Tax=Arthrobacter sp. NPDC056727 TaxID=3345927 RepID=UPI00366AAAAD